MSERGEHWPKAGVSTAVFRDGAVLLVRRAKAPLAGLWSLPGGHVEAGEPLRAAAARELTEETGVEAETLDLAGAVDVILRAPDGSLSRHYIVSTFAARWRRGEPVAASDTSDARFVPLAELASYPLTEGALAIIHRAARLIAESDPASQS